MPEHLNDHRADHLLDRRTLLSEFGRGVLGVAVFGGAAIQALQAGAASNPANAVRWARANLGFVSAYVIARGKEVAVIDTGTAGSAAAIEKAVRTLGMHWDAVRHVVLTHRHADHVGSLPEVLKKATRATAYAGRLDVPNITSPRPVRAVDDGDSLFGLQVVATPGHTPGHIAVLEPTAGILLVGDAAGTKDGAAIGPNPRFTEDMAEATASVAKLADLRFDVLLPGHGDPLTRGAAASLAKLR